MTIPIHVNSGQVNLVVERFGQGPPLIFAHGLTANRHVSRRQLASLSDRFQIIVFDQRGHGDSTPVEDPSLYAVEEMAEDIGAVMDALEIDRAIVGGESMGAATALAFAVREANRVEALLLTAPAFGDAPNSEVERFDAIAAAIESTGTEEFLAVAQNTWRNDLGWPPEAIDLVSVMFRSHRERSLVTAIRSVIRWIPFPDLRWRKAACRPVLHPLSGRMIPCTPPTWPCGWARNCPTAPCSRWRHRRQSLSIRHRSRNCMAVSWRRTF